MISAITAITICSSFVFSNLVHVGFNFQKVSAVDSYAMGTFNSENSSEKLSDYFYNQILIDISIR